MRVESFYLRQRFLDENEYLRRTSEELEQSSASSSCSSGSYSSPHTHENGVDSSKLCSRGCGHIDGRILVEGSPTEEGFDKRKLAMEGATLWLKEQREKQVEKSGSVHS